MQERTYVQRNREIQVREVTDLVALRAEDDPQGASAEAAAVAALPAEVPESQVRAFQDAGWVFRERSAQALPEGIRQAKVFVRPDGRLALSTAMLTVQFREDVSPEQANTLLKPYGSRVAERLTFAPGLYRIAVNDPAAGDALEVASRLIDSGLVKFAEPDLIEEIGRR